MIPQGQNTQTHHQPISVPQSAFASAMTEGSPRASQVSALRSMMDAIRGIAPADAGGVHIQVSIKPTAPPGPRPPSPAARPSPFFLQACLDFLPCVPAIAGQMPLPLGAQRMLVVAYIFSYSVSPSSVPEIANGTPGIVSTIWSICKMSSTSRQAKCVTVMLH